MAEQSQRKVALVTGSSRGIGAAIAERLARDGFDVLVTYRSSDGAAREVAGRIREHGVEADVLQYDAADPSQAATVVDRAVERFGRLDVLVNNAGVFEVGPIGAVDEGHFDRQFAVNVRAVFLAANAAAKVLPEGGRIINIGSALGERVPLANASVYAATKFAVNGLTRGWARDLGPRGITVNAVQPGPIDTEMNPDEGDFAEVLRKMVALGRYGKAAEVAEVVAFLASPAASYVNGAALNVDGGWVA